jgi:hypothetical protein
LRSEPRRDVQRTTQGLDRRAFLKSGAAAIVMAGVAPWLIGSSSTAASSPFTKAQFQALVGQWFHVAGPSWQAVQLVAVQDGPVSPRADQFDVIFRGAANAPVSEGLHTVAPPTGASFDLFLQPTGVDRAGTNVRASFNILLPGPVVPSCAAPA